MRVIYAEKPDMARKIAAALNQGIISKEDGYIKIDWQNEKTMVTWGYGHLTELQEPVDYNPEYKNWYKFPYPWFPEKILLKPREDAKEQIATVNNLFQRADSIINATDDDREGEAIFSNLMQYLGCTKPYSRVSIDSTTPEGLRSAFRNPADMQKTHWREAAGEARGIVDMEVGSNLTVAMTLTHPGDGVWSIGRVQTPTLNMVVAREKAIRNFTPEKFKEIECTFTTEQGVEYKGKYEVSRPEHPEELLKDMSELGMVTDIRHKAESQYPPYLYSLGTLQMEASKRLGMSASETLQTAQKLYEKGITTYPRTKSQYLTDDMEPVIASVLGKLQETEYGKYIKRTEIQYPERYFNSQKVESHYAIIPTGNIEAAMTEKEKALFDLIAKSVICMTCKKAQLDKVRITTTISPHATESRAYNFLTTGTSIVEAEWMDIIGKQKEGIVPELKEGQQVAAAPELVEKVTQPPKRYTEGELIKAMMTAGKVLEDKDLREILASQEVQGIGTEATRAGIIESLVHRKFISREGKSIKATEKGIALIDALPEELESLKSPIITAQWEQRLEKIEKGTDTKEAFIKDMRQQIAEWCSKLKKAAPAKNSKDLLPYECPLCGKKMRKTKLGYGCSGYPECQFMLWKKQYGTEIPDQVLEELLEYGTAKKMLIFQKKDKKGTYRAALTLQDGKVELKFPAKGEKH